MPLVLRRPRARRRRRAGGSRAACARRSTRRRAATPSARSSAALAPSRAAATAEGSAAVARRRSARCGSCSCLTNRWARRPDHDRAHDEVEHDGVDDLVRAAPGLEHAGDGADERAAERRRRATHSGDGDGGGSRAGSAAPHSAVTNAPTVSCPSAPMLKRPARSATATAEPGEDERRRLEQHLADAVAVAPGAGEQQAIDVERRSPTARSARCRPARRRRSQSRS